MKKAQETSYSTGSINFRITASGFAGMFFAFAILDAVLVAFDMLPTYLDLSSWPSVSFDSSGMIQNIPTLLKSARYITIFVVEIILLILKIILGSRSVKHKLEPVEALSDMVIKLNANGGAFNEDHLKALEEAIDHMDEYGGSEALNTGDKELAGLELAVNGLVKRMRDSYMQQARFVSDASHELRTPIAVIKGYADMLDRWGKNDEKILDESVEAIKSESDHMSYLVEQLLFLARGDCGKTKLKIEKFDLQKMIKDVYEESSMIDDSHQYVLKDNGPVNIKGDITLLKQTARVLVDNAKKYTPAGEKITLSAGWKSDTSGVAKAYFAIQDNGIGMSQSALPYMFDRFYRADDSRSKNTGGTGLGLSIAKWIVDRHGGNFEVISREDIGTRITVVLPQKR